MKLSSKSILSPSQSREPPQMSQSSSLSKRLVSNGGIKGGQASPNPMFPSGGRKRGPGFENPEPSSPKVTCIGQVRVKTMKQGKKMRARSKRRGGEASFRRAEQNLQAATNPDLIRQKSQRSQSFQHQNSQHECLSHRNQRWVHVPSAICEALKAFGAEFSCFFPCWSSCGREKETVKAEAGGSGGGQGREASRGAALGSWLVTLQEGDDPKGREIELVMGDEEDTARDNSPDSERNHRRRRHVFEDIDIDIEKLKDGEEEKARVNICIPPKNALLLMRCRSDPVKMAALANRFWEPGVQTTQEDDDENNGDEEKQVQMEEDFKQDDTVHDESEKGDVAFVGTEGAEATNTEANEVAEEANEEKQEAKGEKEVEAIGEVKDEENDVAERSELSSSAALPAPPEPQSNDIDAKGSTEKGTTEEKPVEENVSKERESGTLPECLLLMMCEPKLSMEVSRETWVCTADFIRWLPPRPAAKTGGADRQPKKRVAAVDNKPPPAPSQQLQPSRSSCSLPVAAAAAVGPNGLEPSALKRCKSEPRKSAAKLAPEACSWNNRKLFEPHPPAPLGVGAAGVGF